jgi:hypothetical protein
MLLHMPQFVFRQIYEYIEDICYVCAGAYVRFILESTCGNEHLKSICEILGIMYYLRYHIFICFEHYALYYRL